MLAWRQSGQGLLDTLAEIEDFEEWDKQAHAWAEGLETYIESSPHLGKPEAMSLLFWEPESGLTKEEAAARAIQHRIDRLESNLDRFGEANG